jgi:5-methylcytosine-specific restriction endonuclease McrA
MRKANGQFEKGGHWREPRPFREREWLLENYVVRQRSTGDIAAEFGTTDAAILFWMRKHGIPRRTVSEARSLKHWGASGADNPMWNKRGELNPRWLGGVTPERQEFYTSREWKAACSTVWKRDKARCRRCDIHRNDAPDMPFHIHHIISFADKELRGDPSNLVLLCEACHQFVHSRGNLTREYLPKEPDTGAPA